MIVVADKDGNILYAVETPEDAKRRAEAHAERNGGSAKEMPYEEYDKLVAERSKPVAEVALALPDDVIAALEKARTAEVRA